MAEQNLQVVPEPEDIPFISREQYVRDVFASGGCICPDQPAKRERFNLPGLKALEEQTRVLCDTASKGE